MASPRLELLAQPMGGRPLGTAVLDELQSRRWQTLRVAVAFLKQSGMRQLALPLDLFLQQPGAEAHISVGVDHGGTSLEGLQDLWRIANARAELYVFKEGQGGSLRTFHPKTYLFESPARALAIIGSGNATAGGLFLNHELALAVELDLSDRASARFHRELRAAMDWWQTPSPACRALDAALLRSLYESGELPTEKMIAQRSRAANAATRSGRALHGAGRSTLFGPSGASATAPTPPALPPMAAPVIEPTATPVSAGGARQRGGGSTSRAAPGTHSTFVIEVRPHENGEVFLSKTAINEDPGFFGYPFSGWTTPHRTSNPPYPMLAPDPAVEIVVYDRQGTAVVQIPHELNVVYYTRKSEIRITIPPQPLAHIPPMSLLAMTRNPSGQFDYKLEFFPPGCRTPHALSLRASLTTPLPSGGLRPQRHYGWI